MPSAWICPASLALLAACSSPSAPEIQEAPRTRVAVVISTTTPQVKLGAVPELKVILINEGEVPVTLVEAGDGSESGWRTPVIEWQPSVPVSGRCGNVNPLGPDEVFDLNPGERRRLCAWVGLPYLFTAGRHRVSVTYRNDPDLEFSGLVLGAHDPKAMQRVRSSTPVVATSNVLEIEVVE